MSAGPAAPPKASQQVFVCYRREETAAHAGRVYDAMVARFGERNVFMDIDMEPGVDFVDRITEVVSGCVALIVVIGPNWATVEDGDGRRRIEDPDDFVRLEVETGLRNGVHVIPALVHGARMPRREDLPAELQPLARRNALELSEMRWSYDVGRLLTALDERVTDETELRAMTARASSDAELNPQPLPPEPPGWRLALEGALLAGLAGAAARIPAGLIDIPSAESGDTAKQIGALVARQTGIGAVVGLVLAAWLAARMRGPATAWLRGLFLGALGGALGSAILGAISYLPHENLHSADRVRLAIVTVPVSGAVLGALVGSLWRPRRVAAAAAAGALGGLVSQVLAYPVIVDNSEEAVGVVFAGFTAACIAGAALIAMVALQGRERPRADTEQHRGADT